MKVNDVKKNGEFPSTPEGGVVGPKRYNGQPELLGGPENRWEHNLMGVVTAFKKEIHGRF